MQTPPRRSVVVLSAAVAIGAGVLLAFAGWPPPYRTLEFSGLILAGILTSALATQQPTATDWGTMPLCFVINFTSLLLLGPNAAMFVAAAGMITQRLTDSQRSHSRLRM